MGQNITLCLLIHNVYVMCGQVNGLNPVTRSVSYYWDASTNCATHGQHRHQEDD